MPHPFPLASAFTGGMRRDVDRTELPGGTAYNMVDFIPDEIQAITGGRGGWTYSGPALTAGGAGTPTQIQSIGYHPDRNVVVAADQFGQLYDVIAGGARLFFLGGPPFGPPAYHRGYLIFTIGQTGTPLSPAGVKDDGTLVSFSSAPSAKYVIAYKDHTVIANDTNVPSANHPNRVWFSAAGDPTTWDTSFGWWDTQSPVTGLAGLLNCILIFHGDSTERLRGTTPPPGSDMVLEPFLPNVGCIDSSSIAYWQNRVIWASSKGIHMADGATAVDLTEQVGMKSYWQSLLSGYSSTWRIAGGVYRDHYIISINNGSTLVDCLCANLNGPAIWRFSNLHGGAFVNVQVGQQEKLYMGQWNAGRIAELSLLWSPSATVKQDGDGTNPTPIVETGMFRGFDRLHRRWIESMGKQKWRWGYVDYDLRDSASDNPTSALFYCTTPTGSYIQAGASIPETTDVSRVKRALNPTQGGATRSQMMGFKYAVTGPYASAKLYTLEGDFSPIDIGSL